MSLSKSNAVVNTSVKGPILNINLLLISISIYYLNICCLLVLIKHVICMTIFYIPNPTQYLDLTTY